MDGVLRKVATIYAYGRARQPLSDNTSNECY